MAAGADRDDEFRWVRDDAARLGVPALTAARVTAAGSAGTIISGIRWATGDPEIVALHGAALNAHSWDSMLLRLGRPALALDLPGHGRSDWRLDADYSARTLARAILPAFADLRTPFLLVGHSRGGLVALHLASALPELVRSLVIVDNAPSHRGGDAHSQQLAAFYARQSFASRDEVVDLAIEVGLGTDRAGLMRGVVHNTKVRADGRVEFAHHLAQLPPRRHDEAEETEQWELLARLRAPVTLVRALRGILTDGDIALLREHRPSISIVDMDGGHNVQRDNPVALAEVIAGLGRRS